MPLPPKDDLLKELKLLTKKERNELAGMIGELDPPDGPDRSDDPDDSSGVLSPGEIEALKAIIAEHKSKRKSKKKTFLGLEV